MLLAVFHVLAFFWAYRTSNKLAESEDEYAESTDN